MKKFLAIALGLAMALTLVACGGNDGGNGDSGEMNGTYTAQVDDAYAEESGHGWRDTLTVTYENGTITSATFESYDMADGTAKSTLGDNYPMDPPVDEWIPALSAQAATGTIDGVAGATTASHSARELLKAIQSEGKAGETITVTVGAPE